MISNQTLAAHIAQVLPGFNLLESCETGINQAKCHFDVWTKDRKPLDIEAVKADFRDALKGYLEANELSFESIMSDDLSLQFRKDKEIVYCIVSAFPSTNKYRCSFIATVREPLENYRAPE